MICKEGHIRCAPACVPQPQLLRNGALQRYFRKSLKNRYFELKVGENFEPLLFVYYSQEDADQGAYKYRLNLAGGCVICFRV